MQSNRSSKPWFLALCLSPFGVKPIRWQKLVDQEGQPSTDELSNLALKGKITWVIISLSAIAIWLTQPSPAQTRLVSDHSEAPLELSLLQPSASLDDGSVITSDTISQHDLTIPSLWWAKEQFGGKLLDNWLAYPTDGTTAARIDLVVNQQIWSLLNYLERYEFVNHFGTVARDYGYNVRVFNYQKELLATYTCNFSTNPPLCNIDNLDATGKAGVRGSAGRAGE